MSHWVSPSDSVGLHVNLVFVNGFVRPDVRSLELLFEDGESVEIELLADGYFIHQLAHATGMRDTGRPFSSRGTATGTS